MALAVEGSKTKYACTIAGYAIRITNPGNATAENVHVYATLPPGESLSRRRPAGREGRRSKVVWSRPALRPGGESVIGLKCTLATPGPNHLQVASSAAR